MSDSDESVGDGKKGDATSHNILRITDELVHQVDMTKKLVVIMIITAVIAIPVSWHVSPLLTRTPYDYMLAGYATIAIAAAFLAIGVRQWILFSKWTKRYKTYKLLQERIDRELDFEREQG